MCASVCAHMKVRGRKREREEEREGVSKYIRWRVERE